MENDNGFSFTFIMPLFLPSFFFKVRKVRIGSTIRSMYLRKVSAYLSAAWAPRDEPMRAKTILGRTIRQTIFFSLA